MIKRVLGFLDEIMAYIWEFIWFPIMIPIHKYFVITTLPLNLTIMNNVITFNTSCTGALIQLEIQRSLLGLTLGIGHSWMNLG